MLTRRALLRGLPLLLTLPQGSQAHTFWRPAAHPLNDPRTCLGWWLTTPLSGSHRWGDLVNTRLGTLTNMGIPTNINSGLQRITPRRGGWGHMQFNGDNDAITIALASLGDALPNLTISCWIRIPVTRTGVAYGIISRRNTATDNAGWYLAVNGSNKHEFHIRQDPDRRGKISTLSINDGLWHHIAATLAGGTTGTMTLYRDGQVTPTTTTEIGTVESYASPVTLTFGRNPGSSTYLLGGMDDVRLYSRALSAMEMRMLYEDAVHGYPTLLAGAPLLAFAPPVVVLRERGPSILFGQ